MIELGYVLRRAWEVSWRHRPLWLFGFFVSLGAAGTHVTLSVTGGSRWERLARGFPPEVQRAISDVLSSSYSSVALVLLVLVVLVVAVGLALLGALGRAALVDQVRAAEESGRVHVQAGLRAGRRYLWPVFLVRLILGLPVAAAALAGTLPVVGTSLLAAGQEGPGLAVPGLLGTLVALFACLFPAACLAALVSVPASILQRLAVRALVLERLATGQSIVRAWEMLREHLAWLVLVWLILTGVGIGALIAVALPLALAGIALAAVAFVTAIVSPALFFALLLVAGLGVWLVGAAATSVVETFTSAVWTLVYREMTGLGLTGEETLLAARPSIDNQGH